MLLHLCFDDYKKHVALVDSVVVLVEGNSFFCRLLERVYIDFVRMGAKFDDATRVEYADIQGELPPPPFAPPVLSCVSQLLSKEMSFHPCGGKCI